MDTLLASVSEYISSDTLIALTIFSVVAFIGTLIAIPAILIRLPADYFQYQTRRPWMADSHPILRTFGFAIKNSVGVIFLLAGLAMLFLPGQGVLTMIIGISLLDFPGKLAIERKLISQPTVFRAINALREKCGHPPFHHPDHEETVNREPDSKMSDE